MKTHIYSYTNGTSTKKTGVGSKVGDASNQSRCLKSFVLIRPGLTHVRSEMSQSRSISKFLVVSHFGPEPTSPFVSKQSLIYFVPEESI